MAMTDPRLTARALRWTHLWLGIIGGVFLCLMSVTGAIVMLRPQIAAWMAPVSPQPGCAGPIDWNRAEYTGLWLCVPQAMRATLSVATSDRSATTS